MRLQILHVQECPNVGLLRSRLDQASVEPDKVDVELQIIHHQDEATISGMTGSPTLLIDGVDPFGSPDRSASMSCRLYLDETGSTCRAPSVIQLRDALAVNIHSAGEATNPLNSAPDPSTHGGFHSPWRRMTQ